MDFPHIKLETEGPLGILSFNHPQTLNSVSPEMLQGLDEALSAIEGSQDMRALIITGEGKGFCSGANLSGIPEDGKQSNKPRDIGSMLETHYHPTLRRIRNLDMPIITAVNGPAAGIGMSFALMGDMILASEGAYFLQAFRRIGLVPDGGSTWLLPRLVGIARAKEMALMGEKVMAPQALEWGLINRVYKADALMGEAKKLGKALAEGPTVALSLIRKAFWESTDNSYEEQLNLERNMQKVAGQSADSTEGILAFIEKRAANFKGE